MSTTIQTLLWEFWRPTKWRLLMAFCAMLLMPGVLTLIDLKQMTQPEFRPMISISQMITIWLNFVICSLMVGYGTGFPRRHYSLPISTRNLVFTRLLPGAVSCSVLYLLVSGLFNGICGSRFPYLGPALTYGVGYMLGYAVVSWVYGRENLRALAGLAVGYLVGVWIFGHYPFLWSFGPSLGWPAVSSLESCVLVLTTGVAWWMTVTSLELDRKGRGWTQPFIRTGEPVRQSTPGRRSVRRFRSPFAALFWQEWRQDGWLWPLALAGVVLMAVGLDLASKAFWPHRQIQPLHAILNFIVGFMALGALLPWCLGAVTAQGRKSQVDKPLPTSLATLPVSDATMAWVTFARSLASVAMSWLCVALIGIVWMTARWIDVGTTEWSTLFPVGDNLPSPWFVTFCVAAWISFVAWFTTTVGTATGLSGRSWIVFLPVSIILFVIGSAIVLPNLQRSTGDFVMLLGITGTLLVLTAGTVGAYVRAWKRKVIRIEAILAGLAILIIVETPVLALYFQSGPRGFSQNDFSVIWRLGLFLALAAATPGVVPLSVHYNRHR